MSGSTDDHPAAERRLLEQVPDLVYRYRLQPDPGFEYVSPSSTAVIGYTPEEHYADPELGWRIVHPDDRPLHDDDGNLVAIVGVSRPMPSEQASQTVSVGDLTLDLAASRAYVAGRRI